LNPGDSFQPAAVILAGGRSSRLEPGPKAMATLAGKPMIRYVIDRVDAQAKPLMLSVQDRQSVTDELGLVSVPDLVQRHRGPLTGLCSAMQYLAGTDGPEWLLLCPCDAPFIPADLATRLHQRAVEKKVAVSVAAYQGVVQPTFSLWNLSVSDAIYEAVMTIGRGGLMAMLDRLDHAVVEWAETAVPPFFNVNTAADLDLAERLLDPDHSAA
jgi:molybdopterin-guanine dinucleotide biosynthesis protein A